MYFYGNFPNCRKLIGSPCCRSNLDRLGPELNLEYAGRCCASPGNTVCVCDLLRWTMYDVNTWASSCANVSVRGGVLLPSTVESRASLSSMGRLSSPSFFCSCFLFPSFPSEIWFWDVYKFSLFFLPVPTGRETPGARKVTAPSVFGVTVLLNSSSLTSFDTSLLLTRQWLVSMSSN